MHQALKKITAILLIFYYWLEGIILTFVPRCLMFKDINGEIVLITGAGSGIGRLMALRFAKKGAIVVLWDINAQGNEETADMVKKQGGQAFMYKCDITNSEEVYSVAAKVRDEVGIVTIIVNNAGIVVGKSLMEIPDDMIQKTFQVNVISHFWILKAFLPDILVRDKGHIVLIASLAGVTGIAKLTDYCASKFAAVGLQEALMLELHVGGHKNIHSTTVCPYFINTGLFKGAGTSSISMLEPEYVADEIIAAVLCNQHLLLLPRVFNVIRMVKTFLPLRALLAIHDVLGGGESMSSFTGRECKS